MLEDWQIEINEQMCLIISNIITLQYIVSTIFTVTQQTNINIYKIGVIKLFSGHSTNSRGVAILFNRNLDYNIHNIYKDNDGNVIILDIEIYNQRLTLANIYGPNRDDPQFYINVTQQIEQFENSAVIIVGDWNMVMNQNLDTKNYRNVYNQRAKVEVRHMQEVLNLRDIWRENNPEISRYTWRQKNQLK